MSIELENEVDRILKNQVGDRHRYFQLQYFLIGKEPTIQAKLWRCVTELKTRKETTEAIKLEIDDVNDTIELINIKIDEITGESERKKELKKRKLERKKTELKRRLESLFDRLQGLIEETAFIVKAFNSLEKAEPIKAHDDLQSQKDYWNEKLTQELNLRLLFGLPLDLELLKTILALSSDCQVKKDTVNLINEAQTGEFDRLLHQARSAKENKVIQGTEIKNGI